MTTHDAMTSRKHAGPKKGLALLGIDATDFPPPLMQQSKTPNNIKSFIRQVNVVRVPRDQVKKVLNFLNLVTWHSDDVNLPDEALDVVWSL